MSTEYNKTIWQNGDVISVEKLNKIENGIAAVSNTVNSPAIYDTATGPIASFSDGADDLPMKSAVVTMEPIQEGTGNPSPENVRPISGRTDVSVVRSGKNLIDDSIKTVGSSGLSFFIGGDGSYNTYLVADTYTFSCVFNAGIHYALFMREKKDSSNTTLWAITSDLNQKTFTLSKNGYYRFWFYNTDIISPDSVTNIMLEFGSTATDYEFYKGSTVSVNWQTEAGTVYGGYVDVVSGKLVVDRAIFTESGSGSIIQSQSNRFYITKGDALRINAGNQTTEASVISDRFKSTSWAGLSNSNWKCSPVWGTGVAFAADGITTAQGWKDYFTQNPTQFSYKLATPIEIQITPHEVHTLLGENNIWSDGGDVTAEYPADTKLYIDRKIAEALS